MSEFNFNLVNEPSTFGKVAVLFGGKSAEREVSLASGQAVMNALLEKGIDAHPFDPKLRSICELKTEGFERAFIAMHGRGGEDGSVQGALEQLGIVYTGSGVSGSALSIDKVLSKLIWHARGLSTSNYFVVNKTDLDKTPLQQKEYQEILDELGGKVMVKPSLEGSSLGMKQANNTQELASAIDYALRFDNEILIEQFIDGPEYTVAILDGQALPSISMKSASGFYDYEAKYHSNTTEYFCPSGLNEKDEKELQNLAIKAFSALNGEGWGRVDIMRGKNNQFFLLESNTVPGMTKTSLVPKAAKQAGLSFADLCLTILSQTLNKNIGK